MLRLLALFVVFCVVSIAGLGYLYKSSYPFVLASEEARRSLEVTDEQMSELKSAALSSDMIAFGIMGAVLAGGFAALLGKATQTSKRPIGLVAGAVLGLGAGALGAMAGHWFVESPPFDINDPMLYSFVRWILILGGVAGAAGLATALVGNFQKDAANAVIGALIGLFAAAAIYALASGSMTTAEQKNKILPHHFDNQLLIIVASFTCIGLGIISQLYRNPPKLPEQPSAAST
jgi:MFS family permease